MNLGVYIDKTSEMRELNLDKIQTIEDIKRILKFLDIKVILKDGIAVKGYDEVRDLFEYE